MFSRCDYLISFSLCVGFPFRSLPVVEWDGEMVGQSVNVAKFVARKVGVAGDNDVEMARSEAFVDFSIEMVESESGDVRSMLIMFVMTFFLFPEYFETRFEKDAARKAALIETLVNTALPNYLEVAEALLKGRGGKFATGNKLSLGDLAGFVLQDILRNVDEMASAGLADVQKSIVEKIEASPLVDAQYSTVKNDAKVAAYLAKRPAYGF